jgi:hypothetical protein
MAEGRSKRTTWFAYAASIWAFVFAALSFYWAAGGMVGAETLGEGIARLAAARDNELIIVTWITGVLKVIAGLLALALVQRWGRVFPHWLLRLAAWSAGLLFLGYGIVNVIQHAMMIVDPSRIGELLGSVNAVRWHLALWDPFWMIGGLLFIAAAYTFGRESSAS